MPLSVNRVTGVLLARADQHGTCFPSVQRLIDESGLKKSAVYEAINWLMENDLLIKKGDSFQLLPVRNGGRFRDGGKPIPPPRTKVSATAERTFRDGGKPYKDEQKYLTEQRTAAADERRNENSEPQTSDLDQIADILTTALGIGRSKALEWASFPKLQALIDPDPLTYVKRAIYHSRRNRVNDPLRWIRSALHDAPYDLSPTPAEQSAMSRARAITEAAQRSVDVPEVVRPTPDEFEAIRAEEGLRPTRTSSV